MDFRISVDFWISEWISGFQFGFLPTVYEISFVTDPSVVAGIQVLISVLLLCLVHPVVVNMYCM